jgi:hypothetical protein
MSSIIALVYIRLSELQTIDRKYSEEWADSSENELLGVLHGLGIDVNQSVERQVVEHRNRFGNLITCSRWVGCERIDKEWIDSGYASEEAIAKKLNNGLVNDLFRLRGLTE